MSDKTGISRTEATWNPSTGCDRISPGCDNCLVPETRVLRADMTWVPIGPLPSLSLDGIDWCIIGGESGPDARPLDLGWVRELVAQCRDAGTVPFVKQLGTCWARKHGGDSHGADWDTWPADLRVREFPATAQAVAL